MSLEGCPTNVWDDLKTWIPEGIYVVDTIVTIVNPAAGSVLALASAALPKLWTAVEDAVTEYQSTTPPPTGTLQKVTTALQDLSDQLSEVLAALPVSVPSIDILLIQTGLKLVIATLNFYISKTGGTPTVKAKTAMVKGPVVQAATSRADFVKKFNAIGLKRADGTPVTLK